MKFKLYTFSFTAALTIFIRGKQCMYIVKPMVHLIVYRRIEFLKFQPIKYADLKRISELILIEGVDRKRFRRVTRRTRAVHCKRIFGALSKST